MAIDNEASIALKKRIHMRWTSTQEEIDKTIDYIIGSICIQCSNNIKEKIKKEKMNPHELENYEKAKADEIQNEKDLQEQNKLRREKEDGKH